MIDRYRLISRGFIPLSKYWSARVGFLDTIYGTRHFVPHIKDCENLGDDTKVLVRMYYDWHKTSRHQMGEAGALLRMFQFAAWKFNLAKKFIPEGTLCGRPICANADIINWPLVKLLQLDCGTAQWASAAILVGNPEDVPENFFLAMSKEALLHYQECRANKKPCEVKLDETIYRQAMSFINILKDGFSDFLPVQADDYCFARAFRLITKRDGALRFPQVKGHESNRLEEMDRQMDNLYHGKLIDSRDHRVIQAIAMLALKEGKKNHFLYPERVSKSWPQFWAFLEYATCYKRHGAIIPPG